VVAVSLRLPPCPRLASLGCLCLLGRLTGGNILLEVLKAKLQLIGAQLLRPPAELLAQQTLDQQLQLLDLGITFADRILQGCLLLRCRGHYLAQHLLQWGGVIRQGAEVDRHAIIVLGASASTPMIPA